MEKAKKYPRYDKLDYKFSPGVVSATAQKLDISRPTLAKLLNNLDAEAWNVAMEFEEAYTKKHEEKKRRMIEFCTLARKRKIEEIENKIAVLEKAKIKLESSGA